jgi:hypothetical protein
MTRMIPAIALPHPNGEIIALGGRFAQALDWSPDTPCPMADVALVQYYYPIQAEDVEPSPETIEQPEAYLVAVVNIASVLPMKEADQACTRAEYAEGLFTWRFSEVRRPRRALRVPAKIGLYSISVEHAFMDTLRF